jgi:pyruvate-formate lyase
MVITEGNFERARLREIYFEYIDATIGHGGVTSAVMNFFYLLRSESKAMPEDFYSYSDDISENLGLLFIFFLKDLYKQEKDIPTIISLGLLDSDELIRERKLSYRNVMTNVKKYENYFYFILNQAVIDSLAKITACITHQK